MLLRTASVRAAAPGRRFRRCRITRLFLHRTHTVSSLLSSRRAPPPSRPHDGGGVTLFGPALSHARWNDHSRRAQSACLSGTFARANEAREDNHEGEGRREANHEVKRGARRAGGWGEGCGEGRRGRVIGRSARALSSHEDQNQKVENVIVPTSRVGSSDASRTRGRRAGTNAKRSTRATPRGRHARARVQPPPQARLPARCGDRSLIVTKI